MKLAEKIVSCCKDSCLAALVAEQQAHEIDQIWAGDGYTKYYFDDNSALIHSGSLQYALDADNEQSIRGYAAWLGADTHLEDEEIDRLLDALSG